MTNIIVPTNELQRHQRSKSKKSIGYKLSIDRIVEGDKHMPKVPSNSFLPQRKIKTPLKSKKLSNSVEINKRSIKKLHL